MKVKPTAIKRAILDYLPNYEWVDKISVNNAINKKFKVGPIDINDCLGELEDQGLIVCNKAWVRGRYCRIWQLGKETTANYLDLLEFAGMC